jgi:hypothetical protein
LSASATYIGAPPQMMVLIRSGFQSPQHSTSRFTMVGAANIEVRGHASNRRSTSSASNEFDSGVTLMPSRATVAIM